MFTKNELSITLFAGIFLASMLLVSFTNTPVYASHYCDHQWVEAGAIFYTNNLQFNKQSYSTSDSPNVSGKVNDCNIDEVKIVITDSCEKIVATATSSVPRNQGDYQDSFWVQVQASDWYYSGTYRADASANGNKISSTTMSFNGPGPQISSSSDPNCSKPKPLASDVKAPTVSLPSVGAGWVSLSGNSKVGNTSYSSSGSFGYEISSGNIKNGKGSANVKVSGPVSNNYGQNCSISGTFYTTFSVKGQISNGKLIFTPYNISPSSLPAKLTCSNTTFLDGDSYNVSNPLSFSESMSLSHSQGTSQTESMSFSSGSSTWKAIIEKIPNSGSSVSSDSSSSGSSTSSSSSSSGTKSSESGTFRYTIDHPRDSTYEAGASYVGGKIVTPFSSHKHSLNIWYTVSGNAAHWIGPQKLDFGMMTPGKQVKLEYEIQVSSDTPPGNYEYTWTMGCSSLFENVICNSEDTVYATVEPGRWSPPDSTSQQKSSISDTKDLGCPEGSVYYKTAAGHEVCAIVPSKDPIKEIIPIPSAKIGAFAAVTGNVEVKRFGTNIWTSVQSGTSLNSMDAVRTSENSKAQIMLMDGTVFSMGSKTEMIMDEFVFDPNSDYDSLLATLKKGVIRLVTGSIAQKITDSEREKSCFFWTNLRNLTPEQSNAICIKTPGGGVVGIRGSDVIISSSWEGSGQVVVLDGEAEILTSNGQTLIVGKGNGANFDPHTILKEFVVNDQVRDKVLSKINVIPKDKTFENCPQPVINKNWFDGYFINWTEISDDKKIIKGFKIGYEGGFNVEDYDWKMSNIQIDCNAKTLSVDLEGSGSKNIIGELYIMENSKKNPTKANLAANSMSISVDDREINYQLFKSTSTNSNTEFSFLTMPEAKTISISNLSLIPEPLQKIESNIDSTPKQKIPEWIKNNVKWWADGTIDDSSFKQGIQHMIKENIISIKDMPKSSGTSEDKIPEWIKQNAKWWADGTIGEEDFVNGLKYMVEKGIIGVN